MSILFSRLLYNARVPPKPTMMFRFADGLLMAVHLGVSPSEEEWNSYCAETHRVRHEMKAVLIYTLGGAPNSKQREQVRLAFAERHPPPPMAVLTSSTLVRGIITSLNWFMSNRLAAFALHDLAGALQYLEGSVGRLEPQRIQQQLDSFLARLESKPG